MFLLVLLVFFLFLLSVVFIFYNVRYKYWNKRGVPNPSPFLFFGNCFDVITGRRSIGDVVTDIYNNYKKQPCVGYFKSASPVLLIRDPDFVKTITVKDFQYFTDNDVLIDKDADPIIGRNPFFLKGQEWKTVRAQLTPCFTGGKMKLVFPLMMETANRMVEYIESNHESVKDTGFEAKELCSKYTIDNVASCAFGLEGKCFEEENSKMRDLARRFLSPGTIEAVKFTIIFTFPWLVKFFSIKFVKKEVEDELQDLVKTTLKYRKKHNIIRNDFLDIIGQLKETCIDYEFTDVDLTAHAASFFGDGFETSSLVMSFVLFELGLNPDVQEKLRQEIEESLNKHDRQLTYDAINGVAYLDAVLEETLRKFPVVKSLNKQCTKTYTYSSEETENFKGINLTIEKGICLTLPTWGLTHDPIYFKDPEKFDPERFIANDNSYRYISFPFGEGPRACLGKRFGILQIKAGVTEIVRNFEIRVNCKTKTPLTFDTFYPMLSPIGGLWLNFHKIKN